MHLKIYTEHAFRVLMYLAKKDSHSATINEISNSYKASRHHIAKVVHHLGLHGFIITHRGMNGGIQLAKDAAEISAGEVVEAMESDTDIIKCFSEPSPDCPFVHACGLKQALKEAQNCFLDVLKKFTLADLVSDNAPLPHPIDIEPPQPKS